MRKWQAPTIKNLSITATTSCGKQTRDYPHMWICPNCKKHYGTGTIIGGISIGQKPNFEDCPECGAILLGPSCLPQTS